MSEYTEYYNLEKPAATENYDIEVANKNNQIIDTALHNKVEKQAGKGLSTNDFTDNYKKKIDSMQTLYRFKGTIETVEELDTINTKNVGDTYKCLSDKNNYIWNGTEWVNAGQDEDLTELIEQIENLNENINDNKTKIAQDRQCIGNLTDNYDTEKTYSVGDVVIVNNRLWKCTTPVTTAEEFDITKWQKTSLKEMMEVQNITTAGTDLNNYVSNGVYFFQNSSVTPINVPAGTNGWLVVLKGTLDQYTKQIWFRYGSESNHYQTYVRTNLSGVWTEWKKYSIEEDTGWIDLTLTSDFKNYNNNNNNRVRYRKCGQVVQIIGTISPTKELEANAPEITIGTLPENFRPVFSVPRVCQGSGRNIWLLIITPSGEVRFSRHRDDNGLTSVSTSAWITLSETFLVK